MILLENETGPPRHVSLPGHEKFETLGISVTWYGIWVVFYPGMCRFASLVSGRGGDATSSVNQDIMTYFKEHCLKNSMSCTLPPPYRGCPWPQRHRRGAVAAGSSSGHINQV
eukprot:6196462-Pleurochrysis_carterae.AAC.1